MSFAYEWEVEFEGPYEVSLPHTHFLSPSVHPYH